MENALKFVVALCGSVISYLFGGWSSLLGILLAFVVIDYLSGVSASAKEGKLSSKVGMIGILRKVMIFAVVAVAHLSDIALMDVMGGALDYDGHLIRDAAIIFYLANEGISIIENCGRMGLPVPPSIRKAIEIFSEKSEHAKESEKS